MIFGRQSWKSLLGWGPRAFSYAQPGFCFLFSSLSIGGSQGFPPLHLRREAAFSLLIFLMLLTHLLEILLWAGALITTGAVPLFRDAYYYVAVTYTTLGYAEGTLGPQWRILAPMMAMSGLFAFGC